MNDSLTFFPIFLFVQDFEYDPALKGGVQNLLEEMVCNTTLLPAEHKAAANILLVLTKDDPESKPQVNLTDLLKPPEVG